MIWPFSRRKKAPQNQVATITNGPGTFSIPVVGESKYQVALEKICGGRTEDGHNHEVEAFLIPEDDNPYDSQAVVVIVEGNTVGYLDRKLARNFRKQMAEVAPPGTTAKCPGMIVGGWDRGEGDTGHFGVKLDLPAGE